MKAVKSRYVNRVPNGWVLSTYYSDGSRTITPAREVEDKGLSRSRLVLAGPASRAMEVVPALFVAWFETDPAGAVRHFEEV